jgi:type I restriction enzyme S subunit
MIKKYKIGVLFDVEKGTVQSSKNTPGEYVFITAAEEWKTHNEHKYNGEALVFAAGAEGSLGRMHYVNDKFIASDLCYILTPKKEYIESIDLEFYYFYFNVVRKHLVKDLKTGTSKKAINQTNFKNYSIPLFDIEKQMELKNKLNQAKKIATKIDLLKEDISNYSLVLISELLTNGN